MKKNTASQVVGAQMVSATDGSAFTGSVTCYVTGDGGTQAAGSVGSGACTHEGNGFHTYAPAQAETNYDHVAFTFTGSGAVPATVQVYTTFPQTGDNYARLGAPAGASVSADIAAVKAQTAAIETDTQDLQTQVGTDGAGLTAIPWNASWDAEVESEVADALAAYDPPTKAELDAAVANVSVDEIQATALADLFNTDSGTTYASAVAGSVVKEIADNAGGSSLTVGDIADAVWDEALSGHTTAGTAGKALSDAGSAGDPWSTSLPGAYGAGTAGNIIGNNLNAPVGTVDTVVDAIKAVTDNLPNSGALTDLSGDVSAILTDTGTTLPATLSTIAGYIDTEVAAIKAKTDNLPASPAATGDIPTASAIADAVLDEALSGHTSAGTLGKAIADIETDATAILADTNELQTDDVPGLIAGLNDITAASVLAAGDIDGYSLEESLKLIGAATAGKLSGAATTTVTIRAMDDSKARITATVDSDGNRSAVTLDETG